MTDLEAPLSDAELADRLEPPAGPVRAVVDTDAYNEIDDQFAVAYALGAENVAVEALYAAPFDNDRSEGPADGMERSYAELERLLDRTANTPAPDEFVFEGARGYLAAEGAAESDAAADLVERAHREGTLYVVAIGCPTNVAAAIRADPSIREEIVVVWLGGQPHHWHTAREFNLMQDLAASRTLLDSGVPLVQVPCRNVAEHVKTTVPELRARLAGQSALADYLVETFAGYGSGAWWSKEVWDLAAVAWLATPEAVTGHLAPAPHLSDELRWSRDPDRHLMRVAREIDRDAVFAAMSEVV